jgi:DNA-binding PadR family transcriptional regulator
MSALDYHVLLALAAGPLYGYAIKDSIASESAGALTPRAGSLYRVIARLITDGLLREAAPSSDREPHPGHERRYYALSADGRRALLAETLRLERAAALARKRLGALPGRS